MIEHADRCAPDSNTIEDDITNDPERIRRGLELCHRVADSNPVLVVSYLSILPISKNTRQEIEQILLKVAKSSPKTILDNAEQISHTSWGKQAIELAKQNNDK